MESFLHITDIELPTLDNDTSLPEIKDATACADYLHDLEVREVTIKMGERGRMIFSENQAMTATTPHKPIDTTRAGGSFNLAYLTQRSDAKEPKFTATFAIGLALTVIMRPGAVLPEKRP